MAEATDVNPILRRLLGQFPEAIVETHAFRGDATAVVKPERYHDIARFLRNDPECGFDFLSDLTAVDRLKLKLKPRFEIVVHFYSRSKNTRFRLKTRPEAEDEPSVESITDLFPAANWAEREVYDMFGIRFPGHPDLKRILLYEEFAGYPLRKDYPVNKRQPLVQERPIPNDRPGMMF
jgi:NADH-quinone oxidoreductase subunit C